MPTLADLLRSGSWDDGSSDNTRQLVNALRGAAETGMTLGSGALAGLAGMPYGIYKGITSGAYGTSEAPRIAAKEAQQFIERNTYQPRTEQGQEYVQKLGRLFEESKLPPVMPEAALLGAIPKQAYAAQAERAGITAEKALEPAIMRTMERGGKPAQLLQDLTQGTKSQIQAWHGSGNLFPEFDVTRNPEQGYAYTRGSYAAAAKREAENKYMPRDSAYEEKLMNLYKDAEKKQDYDSMEVLESAMLHQSPSDLRKNFVHSGDYDENFAKKASSLIDKIETFPKQSYLYKLDVKDEALPSMLQYDNPISQQSPQIQAFAKELGLNENDLGGDLIGQLVAKGVTGLDIQKTMKEKGIPGLIYNSPDVEGSVNYVTYDPSLYKILEINDKPYEQWFPKGAYK